MEQSHIQTLSNSNSIVFDKCGCIQILFTQGQYRGLTSIAFYYRPSNCLRNCLSVIISFLRLFDQVLLNEIGAEPCPALPKLDHLARAANRVRQSTRPRDPLDVDFDLSKTTSRMVSFKADIKKHGKRHLIFPRDQQLAALSKAKCWYVDGTFKLVKRPFQQLFIINAFMRTDDYAKQLPLVFVLMSGRKKDYHKVTSQLQVNTLCISVT